MRVTQLAVALVAALSVCLLRPACLVSFLFYRPLPSFSTPTHNPSIWMEDHPSFADEAYW